MASAQTGYTKVEDIVVGVLTANPDSTLNCILFPSIEDAKRFLERNASFHCSRIKKHQLANHLKTCEDCRDPAYRESLSSVGYYKSTIDEVIMTSFEQTIGGGYTNSLVETGWCNSGCSVIYIPFDGDMVPICCPQEFLDVLDIDYYLQKDKDGLFIPNYEWDDDGEQEIPEQDDYEDVCKDFPVVGKYDTHHSPSSSIASCVCDDPFGDDDNPYAKLARQSRKYYYEMDKRHKRHKVKLESIKSTQEMKKREMHTELVGFVPELELLKSNLDMPLVQCSLCTIYSPEHVKPSFPHSHARHHIGPVRPTFILSLKYMIECGVWATFSDLVQQGLVE